MIPMAAERYAEIYEKAADVIETVGHCKGYFSTNDDLSPAAVRTKNKLAQGFCVLGAIRVATGYYDLRGLLDLEGWQKNREGVMDQRDEAIWAGHYLTHQVLDYDVALWNDDRDRTPAEVIDLLKHTAKDLRNGTVAPPPDPSAYASDI